MGWGLWVAPQQVGPAPRETGHKEGPFLVPLLTDEALKHCVCARVRVCVRPEPCLVSPVADPAALQLPLWVGC